MKHTQKFNKIISAAIAAALLCACAPCLSACAPAPVPDQDPTELKVNLLQSPMGVYKNELSFSWVMNDNDRDEYQTGYRIVFAEGIDKMRSGDYIKDTGWVSSSKSSAVSVEGLGDSLAPASLYYWAVQTKDKDGNESNLSKPQAFYTALDTADAALNGIWAKDGGGKASDDFAFLRTRFSLEKKDYENVDCAVLTATAKSPEPSRQFVYNLNLNGECVGVGPSRYGADVDGGTVLYYNGYDVTKMLVSGDNALGAICYTTQEKSFYCRLDIFYKDGSRETVADTAADAESWKSLGGDEAFGKSNSIGTEYFSAAANNIDATIYPFGFDCASFDDSSWSAAFSTGRIDGGVKLAPSGIDNVRRYPSEKGRVKITDNGDSQIVDLGYEIVGGLHLELNSPFDCEIELRYGEQLNSDGSVKYKMLTGNVYREKWKIKSGNQAIDTIDMLTYRYVEIVNLPVALSREMVYGLEIRTAWDEEEYYFSSDNGYLNDMYELVKNTAKLTTQDLFVDSQSRERRAYEGDCVINMPLLYAFQDDYGVARFSAEYLYTNRTWPAEYVLLCSRMALNDYMVTGDAKSLNKYYDILKTKTFTRYLNEKLDLVSNGGVTLSSVNDCILVDWPETERNGYDMSVSYNTVFNALAVSSYTELAKIAEITGNGKDSAEFGALAERLRASLIEKLYNSEKGAFSDGYFADGRASSHCSQHATAFALFCGIYDGKPMAEAMARYIASFGGIKTSVYGSYFLLDGLYRSGNGDIANRLLLNDDEEEGARTWAYMLYKLGATLTTEAWNATNKDNMTFSHPWGGAPACAITGGIFGITPTSPAYETFDIKFNTALLNNAELTMPTIRGKISAAFTKSGESLSARVTVPSNCSATVYLPAPQGASVIIDNQSVNGEYADGFIAVKIGSGTRELTVKA